MIGKPRAPMRSGEVIDDAAEATDVTLANHSLHLVGLQMRSSLGAGLTEQHMAFYRSFFRVAPEIAPRGAMARYLRYQAELPGAMQLVFMGIEVASSTAVPPGLTAWTLGWDCWQALATAPDGERTAASDAQIEWTMLDDHADRVTGDFRVVRPVRGFQGGDLPLTDVRLTANAYQDFHRDFAGGDTVGLVPYDQAWPDQCARFVAWLRMALGSGVLLTAEHIGSTAIPGMPAKPIIDILVEVPSGVDDVRRQVIPRLNCPEWEYWWYDDHMMFVKRDGFMGQRTHHVHMAPRDSRMWERVTFRDYLRAHPESASAYAALKTQLAASHADDREAYTQAKSQFVRETTARALAWRSTCS